MEYKINTTLPVQFEIIENPPYLNDSRFQAVAIYVAHEKENYNGSYFDLSVLEEMGKHMAGVPIVGYISANNVNEKDFNGHEEKLTIDKDGVKIEYLGRAYGCIISNNDVEIVDRQHEDGEMRKYLKVKGVLWKMFSDAIEIMDRDEQKAHSMELQEDSINGKFERDGYFHFSQAKVRALCILGEGIHPAMSNSTIEKFSVRVADLLKEINDSIKQYTLQNQSSFLEVDNINFTEKEDKVLDEKLELLKTYNLTLEDITFNIEEISLEDLDNKLKEEYEKKPEKLFSVTVNQKREALNNALDGSVVKDAEGNIIEETYFYICDFDDTYVYVEKDHWVQGDYDCSYGRYTYIFDNETITATITSEFEQMIRVWLTLEENQKIQDERAKYEKLSDDFEEYKNNYSTSNSEVERLQNFEKETLETARNEAEKALFETFPQLTGNEEFENLKKKSSEFTLEQLEKEISHIVVKTSEEFKAYSQKREQNPIVKVKNFKHESNDNNPYGDLFDGIKN